MKRVKYSVKLDSDLYDAVEETSEGLLIEWYDDDNNRVLKLENRKRRQKEEDDNYE